MPLWAAARFTVRSFFRLINLANIKGIPDEKEGEEEGEGEGEEGERAAPLFLETTDPTISWATLRNPQSPYIFESYQMGSWVHFSSL